MNFSNENISPYDLPSVTDVVFYPLESAYLTTKRITSTITALVLLLIGGLLIYFIDELHKPAIIAGASALFFLFIVINWVGDSIGFRYSGYALRDKDVWFRRGWLIRKARVVPLNRVQHVSVQSGPIERRFGLASVSIFTAGSGSADFTIHGVKEEKAQQIKEWISNQLNGAITNEL